MTEMSVAQAVVVGVDTHKDVHVAAALDSTGRVLGYRSVATTLEGLTELRVWAEQFGPVVRYGIEGTGSYGAGLAGLSSSLCKNAA